MSFLKSKKIHSKLSKTAQISLFFWDWRHFFNSFSEKREFRYEKIFLLTLAVLIKNNSQKEIS